MISISTYNSIQRQFIRQEKLSSKSKTSHSLESSKKYFTLPRRGKRFLKLKERFIQYLIDQSIKYSVVFGHQEKIAEYLKCDVRHLRKIIKDLRLSGWITVIATPGLCNIYILNEIFDDREFCIGMNYIFNNLMVDKDIYRQMYASKHLQEQLNKKEDIRPIHFVETVYDDERFRPIETDHAALDEIFSINVSSVINEKVDHSKMPSILKDVYTHEELLADDGADWYGDSQSTYTCTVEINIENPQRVMSEDIFPFSSEFKSESISVPNKKGSTAMQALPTVKDMIPYADKLKSIRPLLHGAIMLSAFPEEVVLHADERTLKCKKPLPTALDRWKYLMSVCKGYCTENNIETSWAMTLNIRDRYSIHKDTPMFDENHAPAPSISLKSTGKGIPTAKPQVTWEEAVRNNQQWSNSALDLNKELEFSNAISTLEKMATTNPFAALLMKTVQQSKPQTVDVIAEPVKPFDRETMEIVTWIKSNWDDTLFPHSNKWVRDNIERVLSEGPTSPQYLDGSFLNGMKRIKMLMVELLKKPKVNPVQVKPVQSIPVQEQPHIEDDEVLVDYSSDPFGDRL